MPADVLSQLPAGAYRDGVELLADLQVMQDSVMLHHSKLLADTEMQRWLDLAGVFGLHLTRLDVRQDACSLREIMTEVVSSLGLTEAYGGLPEARRCEVLTQSMPFKEGIRSEKLAPLTLETLDLFRLLHQAVRSFGPSCLGEHVISLTQCASDVLNVLWLWR